MRVPAKYSSTALPILAALFFAGSTIAGAVRWFSPVPYWDMWDGYVAFFLDVSKGDWSQFFAQANEHRIVFSKILFWLDMRYFAGQSRLLIASNVALLIALWTTFAYIARRLIGGLPSLMTAALVAIPCFSWMQAENITWSYQSQFFVAYLFPLAALVSLARSLDDPKKLRWFLIALVLGIASYGSMGNGILGMPALIAAAILSGRATRSRILVLLGTTIICTFLWFHGYESPGRDSASLGAMIVFTLAFLGSPFGVVAKNNLVAVAAGTFFVSASILLFVRWWRAGERDPLMLTTLTFLAYVGATAAGAAHGRASMGVEIGDFSSRYTTPALMGWATLLIVIVAAYRDRSHRALVALSILLPIMFLWSQLPAFDAYPQELHKKQWLAALALDLGVMDNNTTMALYPTDTPHNVKRLRNISDQARNEDLSVFSNVDMRKAREFIGKSVLTLGLGDCLGRIDQSEPVKTDSRYVKVAGWAFNDRIRRVPSVVFLASNNVVVGAAFTGYFRPDVEQGVDPKAIGAGFTGYMLADALGKVQVVCQK
ncbi:hypothetical protein [Paraburkholderia nemoris]|uniref:hypothetical protein n=1 Tax=Paraburkholderia nemoris TaxID=2793076 RepID=UPI001B04D64A|nr:hypothetical protein [Paraburkholderia nemoris]CAE6726147.1 hypothetical protein R75777_01814 [Paraburkholderia nemoris]